jgi:integrase/recombinase XerD
MADKTFGNPMRNPEDWLSRDFVDVILDKAKETNAGYRNFLIVLLLVTTGRRIGELLDLKVKDINWEEETIVWNIEKKHKFLKDEEGFPIPNEDPNSKNKYLTEKIYKREPKSIDRNSLAYLKDYIEQEGLDYKDYVFYSPEEEDRSKKHLARTTVWIFMNKISKALDIPFHPHTFRHTFAVWIAKKMESPADLKKLRDLLEHSDTKVTETYLKFNTKETKNLLEKTFGPEKEE